MKKFISKVILASAITLTSFSSFAQNVDEVINKHIAAMGGKEKLTALKTVRLTGSVEVGPNLKAPVNMCIVDNKASKMEISLQGLTMIQAYDGTQGWMVNPFGGNKEPEMMNEDMIKEFKEQTDLAGPLFNYKEKGHQVELVGKEDMEGTDTYKLKVVKKNGNISYMYLDASSFLQLKETSKSISNDQEVESETLLSDYRNVDGIMFPFIMEERAVGAPQGQQIIMDKIEVNPVIEASIFTMPEKK